MKRGIIPALLLTATLPTYAAEITAGGNAIILSGLIGPDDAETFKVRAHLFPGKAMAILSSPGGNLLTALAIGEFIRLRGWSTYVSDECDSACALIWLGGTQRLMTSDAKIGFHAASINGEETGLGNAVLGTYLNKIGLSYGAVIYATQAGPYDITYLTPSEAKRVGIDVTVVSPAIRSLPGQFAFAHNAVTKQTPPPDLKTGRLQAENEASFLVRYLFGNTSNNAKTLTAIYWDSAMYYGKMTPILDILVDKQRFFEMWPSRSYTIRSMMPARCPGDDGIIVGCKVSGIVDWEASSPSKKAVGSSTFEYELKPWPLGSWSVSEGGQVGLRIAAETGKVLSRQVTDSATTVPKKQGK
jgi:hypothetical protein